MSAARQTGTKSRKRGPYAPEVTRKQIVSAALALFSERGFHSTTVDAIVTRAKVTKGAFYYHFDSKDDVLREIHSEYASELLASAREVNSAVDVEPVEQLRQLIERAVVLLGRYHEHVAVFYQEFRFVADNHFSAIRRMKDEQEQTFLAIADRAKKAGQIRPDVDSKLLLFAVSGISGWTHQWYRPEGEFNIEFIARSMADIILKGVEVEGAIGGSAAANGRGSTAKAARKKAGQKATGQARSARGSRRRTAVL
jgi:TetR/AcrR family transcriptional regulator, cholesterol catabolism regulator